MKKVKYTLTNTEVVSINANAKCKKRFNDFYTVLCALTD